MRTALILISLFFSGCSCNWYYNKAVKGGCVVSKVDTIHKIDTFTIKGSRVDTTFNFNHFTHSKDTIVIDNGQVQGKFYYNPLDNSAYLSAKAKDTSIKRHYYTTHERVVVKEKYFSDWIYLIIGLAIILLIMIVLQFKK